MLTRRQFLGLSAGALLSAQPALARPRSRGRVIVVGAGLAGLSAAFELRALGWEAVVLEARDRVGGRVWTIREPFADGQIAEGGGEFIDTTHTSLRAYADRAGLELDDLHRGPNWELDGVTYLNGKRRIETATLLAPGVQDEVARFWEKVDGWAAQIDPNNPAANGAELDRLSVAGLLDQLRLEPLARLAVEHSIRDDYTAEPSALSLLFVVAAEAAAANLPESGVERYRIRGGNDQVPKALASQLGNAVSLSTPVTSIASSGSTVRVTTTRGRVDGDYCVVAAPLPAVRSIAFSPALPPALAGAVANVAYGTGVKSFVQYDRRVWRTQGFSGDASTDLPLGTTWEATDQQGGTGGILLAYTAGAAGVALGRLADNPRLDRVARDIDRIFPGSLAHAKHGFTAAWQIDRWAGGTYSAFAPGQVTRYWQALRRPAGRIYFAGEHTDNLAGYMEGAIRSGKRAAALIHRRGR